MIQTPERRNTDSIMWGLYDEDVLPLWVADMDFTSPPAVIEALQQRVAHGVFGYARESNELKELIVVRMKNLHGWQITTEDIVLLPGVVAAFNLVCQAVAQPGESILIQPPVYPPFFNAPGFAGAHAVFNNINRNTAGEHTLDLDDFEAAIEKDTRSFLLCNPHNPLGRVFTQAELTGMAEICLKHGLVICSDEIHSDLVFEGYRHIPIASLDKEIEANTVTLIAPSKTYNIAGLECSALICTNPELRGRIQAAWRGLLGWVNLMGMTAGAAAYKHGDEWLKQVLHLLQGNRDYLAQYLSENIPGIRMTKPEATYLAWLDCRDLNVSQPPAQFFLEKARVALNNGEDFGEPGRGHVRLNFGCSREILTAALERISRALKQ